MSQSKKTSTRTPQRHEFTPAWIKEARQRLAELGSKPPSQPKALSKQAAVEQLATEICRLLERGYRLDNIVESMNWDGAHFTSSALRSYLKRAKTRAEPAAGRAKSRQEKAPGFKPATKAPQRNHAERPAVLMSARATTAAQKHGNDYDDDAA